MDRAVARSNKWMDGSLEASIRLVDEGMDGGEKDEQACHTQK
jgi:hypothetical protein